MNDKPKESVVGAVNAALDQPKPTNSDHLLSYTPFGLVQYPDGSKAVMAWNKAEAKRLVEWHNAALAAERGNVAELEAWKESAMSVMPDFQAIGKELGLTLGESVHDKILPAIQQLAAAERVNVQWWKDEYAAELAIIERSRDAWKKQVEGLTEALAAERENISKLQIANVSLRAQLAAAVEALQMLRDYQNGCPLPSYEKGWTEAMAMADDALEKVKEVK